MADLFGISSAIRGAVEVYFRCARMTGRTTALLGAVKSGDTVAFINREQARLFEGLCRDRGIKDVKTIVLPVGSPDAIFRLPMTEGRLIFDHVWLEEHYRREIDLIDSRLDHIATQASGYGKAHMETAMLARSAFRWRT